MKKLLVIAFALLSLTAFAQEHVGFLDRFKDPEKGRVVFVEKGNRAFGIKVAYRNFNASGAYEGDGYSILSLINIGNGRLNAWSASPSFSYFVADDVSLGISLDYTGYNVDTDLKLDLRDIFKTDDTDLNVRILNRHMLRHGFGASITARRYLSFFGSETFGIFGEARLSGQYAILTSSPIGEHADRIRDSKTFGLTLKAAAGLCVKLRDNSALTLSIPIAGVTWQNTNQRKVWQTNASPAKMSSFNLTRSVDILGINVGYMRFIKPR
ncbi:MAG: hypothetical protein J6Z27_05180 [Bacteroidales bacterium]|nr:hypothetical protein [Bacteroidales bacterium]